MLTAAKSLGGGFPCAALLTTATVASELRAGDLGTTFGGGPLACALIETVLRVIRRDGLADRARELHEQLRAALPLGPVTGLQGKGLLAGLRCSRHARDVQRELLAADILTGSSADPAVVRLLPPLILESRHIDQLLNTLAALPAE